MSSIRAVYFDLGGVIVRTEDKDPRTKLGKSVGLDYNGIAQVVFDSESAHQASIGTISVEQHWQSVASILNLPESEMPQFSDAFFAGDRIDWQLVNFLRSLRPTIKVGLISNAWPELRNWIIAQKFHDTFDEMIISSEIGIKKPDERIYRRALEKLGVQPEEAVFVDDMSTNVEAAKALGMQGVIFKKPEQTILELKEMLLP